MSDVEFETDSQNQGPAAYRSSYAYAGPQGGESEHSPKRTLMIAVIVLCLGLTLWLLIGLSRGSFSLKSSQQVPESVKMQKLQLPPAQI